MKKENEPVYLTDHELNIIKLICLEIPIKTIASDLKITTRAVEICTARIRKKLNCKTTIGIVVYVQKHKLLSI